jgi:hypothetical protein
MFREFLDTLQLVDEFFGQHAPLDLLDLTRNRLRQIHQFVRLTLELLGTRSAANLRRWRHVLFKSALRLFLRLCTGRMQDSWYALAPPR